MEDRRPPREVKPVVMFGDNKNDDPRIKDFRATPRDASERERPIAPLETAAQQQEQFEPVKPTRPPAKPNKKDQEVPPDEPPVEPERISDGGDAKKKD